MSEPSSLVSLGELSKPVTVLIEKISDAVGGVFRPHQIRRVAQAEADAHIIQAKANAHVTEIQQRAIRRLLIEEGDRQENIENIIRRALPDVSAEAKPEHIEKDWLSNFFDKCRSISNYEMQVLWSRILAEEANQPGSCPKRTVNLLASMDRSEAELFKKFCTFNWKIEDDLIPLIWNDNSPVYAKHGISLNSIIELEAVGLVGHKELPGFRMFHDRQDLIVDYFGKPHKLSFSRESGYDLNIGTAVFTISGGQLALLCGSLPDREVEAYVLDRWRYEGIICD